MTITNWKEMTGNFKHEVSSISTDARLITAGLKDLKQQAECAKIEYLRYQLDQKRTAIANARGF